MVRTPLARKANGTCARCGKTYRRPPSQIGKYCSRECADADGVRTLGPQHKRQGEERACLTCGTAFYAKRGEINRGGGKYCSPSCYFAGRDPKAAADRKREKMRRQGRSGKRNPNFKHGRRAGAQIRGFTLAAKGERVCRSCGAEARHAHHAVPRSLATAGRRDLRNCLPLCARCHGRWHRGIPMPRSVFTADEWAFVSALATPTWLDRRYPATVTAWEVSE